MYITIMLYQELYIPIRPTISATNYTYLVPVNVECSYQVYFFGFHCGKLINNFIKITLFHFVSFNTEKCKVTKTIFSHRRTQIGQNQLQFVERMLTASDRDWIETEIVRRICIAIRRFVKTPSPSEMMRVFHHSLLGYNVFTPTINRHNVSKFYAKCWSKVQHWPRAGLLI